MIAALLAAAVGLGQFGIEARAELERRIRESLSGDRTRYEVSGTVTYAGDAHFFLQHGGEGLKISCAGSGRRISLPAAGDEVTVSGSPMLEGGRVLLGSAEWRKTGVSPLPDALKAGGTELVDADSGHSVNWLRVELAGRAIDRTPNGFAVDVDSLPVTVIAERVPEFVENCGSTRPRIVLRGVAELVLDQSVMSGAAPYVMGIKVSVSDPADIELDPDVVYLANVRDRRTVFALAAVFVLLAAGLLFFLMIIVRQRRANFRTRTLMAERKRMADDIHDTIEQHLVGAGMLIQLGRDKEAKDVLLRAKAELRDIIWGLKNDDMMRLTPAEMLRQTAEVETKKGLFRVTARLAGLPERMGAQQMRDLSLIVREAIGNAVKHGGAKKIAITSDPVPGGGWLLRIANDGEPFDPATAPGVNDGHFGLGGMRERAKRIGAEISFAHERGWMVLSVLGR